MTELKGSLTETRFNNVKVLPKRQISISEMVKGKKVLTIGCVDMLDVYEYEHLVSSDLYQLKNLRDNASSVIGVDINSEGIDLLNEKGYEVYYCDILSSEGIDNPRLAQHFDTIVLSHVIEHVPDVYGFLKSIQKKFSYSDIIIAVPNAYNYHSIVNLVLRRKEVVSNDHCYTFTPTVLKRLLSVSGFEVLEMYFDRNKYPISLYKKSKYLALFAAMVRDLLFGSNGDLIVKVKNKE